MFLSHILLQSVFLRLWRGLSLLLQTYGRRPGSQRLAGEQGISIIELLVTIAIVGVVGAIALPHLNRSALNLSSATQHLVGELRIARANATSRGTRYRVTIRTNGYEIQRLEDRNGDGTWSPDPTVPSRRVDLPPGISINVESGDGIIEFDTRGLVASLPDGTAEIEELTLHDTKQGRTEQIQVWPSGQVQEG